MAQAATISTETLHELVVSMVGAEAWRSRAGSGTGSIFTMEFGPPLPDNARQGEFSLMVYCAWRIGAAGNILTSWHDDSESCLAPGLAALEGAKVRHVELSGWKDLTIQFDNGQELHLFVDFSPQHDFDTSWFIIQHGKFCYSVNTDNTVSREST
ncbi:hypothetical protein F0P96_03890 [Hymenobacter busanensis]|uniref:Uncharacterized protein n=1 Tax=Hymenobacter busanensis TaxID=2607656 RepID=A0A7L4ZTM7_9BACT|nr:hypothetical protein [Hymenobacter busanensis]KAA9339767.1 hypothetical protein F0P96_03890 [Hymenobacter busanensis]QHJ06478.1 hypothetical protein GUY19_03855 [Hymenobacter busanensis]